MARVCRALVTAATRGVGRSAAEGLARRGCDLVVNSRTQPSLEELASYLSGAYGVRVATFRGDLRKPGDVEGMVRYAIRELGGLDVVIVNYGNPTCEPCRLEEAEWSDWLEASSLYLASTGVIARILLEENPVKATMVMISSFTVVEPSPWLIVSDAARAGLSRIARILARYYPEKVRPIVLLLGSFETPGARRTLEEIAKREGVDPEKYWVEKVVKASPLRRTGSFEELANLIAWLAVDSPEYLTGAVIEFDGSTIRASIP